MTIARHVFHATTSGLDRMHAWHEATGEPVFVWGRHSGSVEGYWFHSVKRAFREWLTTSSEAEITVYHDGTGADALGPMDPCPQKLLFLHQWYPRWERNFEWMLRCTGKVAVSDETLIEQLRERFSWIPEKFTHVVPPPLLESTISGKGGTGPMKRTGIWLHGIRWKRHGNRLRSIIDRWPEDAGELEILCSDKRVPQWARKDTIKWSADLPLEFALLRIHTWDSTLLLNDYALDAPWLLRALQLGCFPLVPEGAGTTRIGPWLGEAAPQPYAWGELDTAVELLTEWRSNKSGLETPFREWAGHVVPAPGAFASAWPAVKESIAEKRPPRLRSRKAISGAFPVGLYERVQRLRIGTG